MPARNSRKIYSDHGIYHVYNRGVEKRIIFEDEQDYKVLLSYLKEYLSPLPEKAFSPIRNITNIPIGRPHKNYHNDVELLAYCLMPNHFHLIIQTQQGMFLNKFIQSLFTRYSMYFNKKYNRVGSLFQGRYKAILVQDEVYLLHLSRYIHLNPSEYLSNITDGYSSLAEYLGLRTTKWINSKIILGYFEQKVLPEYKKYNSYKKFISNYPINSKELLGEIVLED